MKFEKRDLHERIKNLFGDREIESVISDFVMSRYGSENLKQYNEMKKRALILDPDKNLERNIAPRRIEERIFKKAFFSYYNALAEVLQRREEKRDNPDSPKVKMLYYEARKNFWYKEEVFFDYVQKRTGRLKPEQVFTVLMMLYPFMNSISHKNLQVYAALLEKRERTFLFVLSKIGN